MTDRLTPDELRELIAAYERLRAGRESLGLSPEGKSTLATYGEAIAVAEFGKAWRELADRVGDSERTYRDLAELAWNDLNVFDAIRFRGRSEGLALAESHRRDVLAELPPPQPDPPPRVRPSGTHAMAVEVLHSDGAWYTIAVEPADLHRHRVDRVVCQDVGADGIDTGLRIMRGPDVVHPAMAVPPAMRTGQTHIGLIRVGRRVTAITDRDIDTSGRSERADG